MIFWLLISCILTKKIFINDIDMAKNSHIDIHSNEMFGGGNIINYNGSSYVITASHVITEDAKAFLESSEIKSEVIYNNELNDIAVLKLLDKEDVGIDYKKPKKIKEGDGVHYWCRPNAHLISYYKGTVSNIDKGEGVIIIDSYAWMGCSGSVIFNDKNEVIGVLSGLLYTRNPEVLHENIVFVSVFKEEYFWEK